MGAGGSHPQAAMMPDPWDTYKCPPGRNQCFFRDKSHPCRQRSSRSNQSFPWRSASFSYTGSVDTFARSELDEGRVAAKKPHRAGTASLSEERRSMNSTKDNRPSRGKQEKTSRRSSGRKYWASSTATAKMRLAVVDERAGESSPGRGTEAGGV